MHHEHLTIISCDPLRKHSSCVDESSQVLTVHDEVEDLLGPGVDDVEHQAEEDELVQVIGENSAIASQAEIEEEKRN